jgi:magnesium transporter
MTIVDSAVYTDGKRRDGMVELGDAFEECKADNSSWVWIGLHQPTPEEFDAVQREFQLHPLAVEDAIKAHQRPKLEEYGNSLFLVLKPARYHDDIEEVEFGEILIFLGPGFLITVRHGETTELHDVRTEVEQRPELLKKGPPAVLYRIVDRIVDDYEPVLAGVEDDIEEVEEQVFSPERTNVGPRVYHLKSEVLDFHRSTSPLIDPLDQLAVGFDGYIPDDMRTYFRDVFDHLVRINDQVDTFREMLNAVLSANLTQVTVQQNNDMRKISAWVAIVAVPTAIAAIYGMNFRHMPELRWQYGYPAVLVVIAVLCFALYRYFKKVGWL